MGKTAQVIINEINEYINAKCSGKYYSNYYVGITKDIEQRLFNDHKVIKKHSCYIWREATDIENARAAEKNLLDSEMQGGGGGGDDSSIYVYCYLITDDTVE